MNRLEHTEFNAEGLEERLSEDQVFFFRKFSQEVDKIRSLKATDLIDAESLKFLSFEERIRTIIREKNQKLFKALAVCWESRETRKSDGGYYIHQVFVKEYNLLETYFGLLQRRLLRVNDVNEAKAFDRRAGGGEGSYIEFIKKVATKIQSVLNEDTLAGRKPPKLNGSLDSIAFNMYESDDRQLDNTYLEDLFSVLITLSRQEFRQFMHQVMNELPDSGAPKIFEEALYGRAKTEVLEKVKRVYTEQPQPMSLKRLLMGLIGRSDSEEAEVTEEPSSIFTELQELGLITKDGEFDRERMQEAIDLLEASPMIDDKIIAEKLRGFLE